MINWLRKQMGLCPHDWKFVSHVMSSSGYDRYYDRPTPPIALGERAECRGCGAVRERFYPDGH